ncbi:MAG: hypothetical protein HRT89_19935, partial [Lentisphaeria bacterium]|nr:hypothetical protein [Lentisphaeria bacterium]NQZ70329.1 hypothetical protein [Lentisphaeria bacterium]
LEKATGKILWQKANPFLESFPEADRAAAKEKEATYKKLTKDSNALRNKIRKLKNQIKKDKEGDHTEANAEIKKLQ